MWVASSLSSLSRYDPERDGVDNVEVGATSRYFAAAFGRIWTSPGAAEG